MKYFFHSITQSRIILFLFIFQMLGVRIFQGIGITLSILIFCMLFNNVKLIGNRVLIAILLPLLCGTIQILKGSPFTMSLNVSIQIFNAIILVYYYAEHNFINDLKPVLKFYAVQALATLVVVNVLPESLFQGNDNILGSHLFYIFYRMKTEIISGVQRLSGWAWEPGCLQLLLNLYLFILIQDKSNGVKKIFWIIVLILATGSTSGYIIMLINFVVYGLSRAKSNFFIVVCVAGIIILMVLPFVWENIDAKLMLGTDTINTSGIIRYRDFYTGFLCLRDYPLFGIEISDLANNRDYQALETEALGFTKSTSSWYQYFDYAEGGYTNGLMGLTMMWGILGIYLLYKFAKCSLWRQFSEQYWFVVPLIIALSLISEPISNTAFFWFFCIFDIVYNRKYSQIRNHVQLC